MTILIIFIILLVAIFILAIFIYNRLIALQNQVREAASDIDVQLTRRYDLIPNLVNTVKQLEKITYLGLKAKHS